MSVHKDPGSEASALEPYHDDPAMTSPQYDRTPAMVQSPTVTDLARPPVVVRSTVPNLPTPGAISIRHPTYVRYPLFPVEFQWC